MRPRKLHWPDQALPTVETLRKQTKEARICRRAQAVRAVVHGDRLHTVADARLFPSAVRRQGVQRFARHGVQGRADCPRPGRPPTVTCALAPPRDRLVDHDPLPHGARHAPWRGQDRATVRARQTGGQ